jgi:hypothetical protein
MLYGGGGIATIPIYPVAPAMRSYRLFDGLPPALKTASNLALLQSYFRIPQPSVRRFVLALLARITGDAAAHPYGDLSEAEYLLLQYAQLPTGDMRGKILALVQHICAANRGDIGGLYEATR